MGAMKDAHNLSRASAIGVTLLSAGLFGIATPAVKPLIEGIAAQLGAGLLYLGMGTGLGAAYVLRGRPPPGILPAEVPWLGVSLLSGGILAPWLIFWGLSQSTATATSLLANTEVVFSTLLARFLFGEHYSGRLFLGVGLIVGGAIALGGAEGTIAPLPALAVVCACAFWGVDNNAMRKIAHADASFVGCVKGLVSGSTNILIALFLGAGAPSLRTSFSIMAVGWLCYGVSFGLYVKGLRVLGAARTSAFYGTAPFAGALVGICLLREPVSWNLFAAACLMGAGVWLHVIDPHAPMGPHIVDVPDDLRSRNH